MKLRSMLPEFVFDEGGMMKVFISVGSTFSKEQERFVIAIEERLTNEGLEPKTVGRNTFGSRQPLTAIDQLMDECVGVVVIALERKLVTEGVEKRGSKNEQNLSGIRIPTPWVQVEAGIAHARGLPLLVIAEKGIHEEGLISEGFDWFIQRLELTPNSLSTSSFAGILRDWKARLGASPAAPVKTASLSIGELVNGLTPAQLWVSAGAVASLIIFGTVMGYHVGQWTTAKPTSKVVFEHASPVVP